MNHLEKMQIKQQLNLLKRKNAIKVLKHVEGRAVLVQFQYSDELYGQVVLKGEKYRLFKELGGFNDEMELNLNTETEPVEIEQPEPKSMEPPKEIKKEKPKTLSDMVKEEMDKMEDKDGEGRKEEFKEKGNNQAGKSGNSP